VSLHYLHIQDRNLIAGGSTAAPLPAALWHLNAYTDTGRLHTPNGTRLVYTCDTPALPPSRRAAKRLHLLPLPTFRAYSPSAGVYACHTFTTQLHTPHALQQCPLNFGAFYGALHVFFAARICTCHSLQFTYLFGFASVRDALTGGAPPATHILPLHARCRYVARATLTHVHPAHTPRYTPFPCASTQPPAVLC